MISRHRLAALGVMLLSVGFPLTARAQAVATSFDELRSLVRPGESIDVIDAKGRTTRGKLGALSTSSLELLARDTAPDGSERFIPQKPLGESDIRQIVVRRRDPVWKGTLIGAAVVGGPWLLLCNPATDWCYYNDGANLYRGLALITTGIGAGIGALIDAAINPRTTVYYHAPNQTASRLRVAPVVSRSAVGLQLSMGF
jgi:hypothetical protein